MKNKKKKNEYAGETFSRKRLPRAPFKKLQGNVILLC